MEKRGSSLSLVVLSIIFQLLFSAQTSLAFTKASSLASSNRFLRYSPMSSPLKDSVVTRGGEQPAEKETIDEVEDKAISTIGECMKLAFAAGVVKTASVLWETNKRTSFLFHLNKMEQADLGLALYDFVAAFGLLGSYNIFRNSRAGDRISPPNLLKLTQTFYRLWLGMTAIESLGSIILASDMNIPYASFVTIFLFSANLFAGEWFHRRTLSKEDQPALASEYAPARTNGIKASRNMIWYAGTLGITALVEFTNAALQTVRAKTGEDGVEAFISGFLDFNESIIVAGLLTSLYKTLLRAVFTSTQRDFNYGDSSFMDYYKAQIKFYGRVSSFFKYQALFTVLGYVAEIGQRLWLHAVK